MWRQKSRKILIQILCGASASLNAAKNSKMDAFVVHNSNLQYQGGGLSLQKKIDSQRYILKVIFLKTKYDVEGLWYRGMSWQEK
jgi:hypothetical protein